MKKSSLLLSFLISVMYISTGCNDEKIVFPDPSKLQKDGAFTSVAGTFKIGTSVHKADYGTLTVLENRTKENSRYIHLPVIRIHSTSKNPLEPVFHFTGGPGMSNMHNLGGMWYLLSEHDLVTVGYRGVDGSSTLDCPEVSKAMKGTGDLLSPESMKSINHAWRASAKRLKEQGVDLDGYTILDVIQDNELARTALGYERINLKSASYGTRVAYFYSLLHPDHIYRSIMIAVNPPGRFVWEPDIIDKQLRLFSDHWSKDSVMSSKTDDLYGTMKNALNNMPDQWFLFPINAGKVKVVTFSLLWKRQTSAMIFDTYIAAQNGDNSGLALLTLAYDLLFPTMFNWGDLASKAVSADFDSARDYCNEMEPPGMPLGAPISKLLWGPVNNDSWPIKSIPEKFKKPQYSDVPTLLLSGSIDLSTPAEFATDGLLPYLKNGKQIILSEYGHMDLELINRENTRRILTSFYNTGIPDTSLNRYIPLDFSVSWGFPRIAKVSLAIVTIVSLILILVIFLLVKLIRKKVRKK